MINKKNTIKHKAKSLPFWSWNDQLEPKKLVEQIRWMNEQRFGGFFMHARAGLTTEYLSDEWFNCVKTCSGEAKRLGMQPWLYDENGWPSGFVGGKLLENKAYRERYLKSSVGKFDEKAAWHYQIVGDELQYITSPCEGECINVYNMESASTVDVLSGEVTDAFLANTHERYKEIFDGNLADHIEGFFTDEPQYYRGGIPYPKEIQSYFETVYGESVVEKLGLLFTKKKGYRTFRYRYWKSCQQLFLTNYAKKIYDWCEDNSVKITGHYVEERCLFTQMLFNAGIMPFFEYLHYPGIDWLCRRYMPVFTIRQLASVAAQLGKETTISEMFAMTGWDVTPLELKSMAEYQYLYGINSMCQHLLPYSEKGERKYDHPAHFSAYNPWVARGMAQFNGYFDALGAWLQQGKERVNVAVFNTIRSAYFEYEYNNPSSVQNLDDSLLLTCDKLAQNHVAFHLLDETLLAKYGSADNGKLRIGKMEYDVLVIPYILTMDTKTEKILQKFVRLGGKVLLCEDKPTHLEGEPFSYEYLHSNITWEDIYAHAGYTVESDGRLHTALYAVHNEQYVFAVNITDNTIRAKITQDTGVLNGVYDVETGGVSYVGETVEIKPKQSKIVCRWKGDIPNKETPKIIEFGEDDYTVEKFTDNYLALDFARLSYDGVHYGKELPIMGIFQKLLAEHYQGKVYLKSIFSVQEKPSAIHVLAENKNAEITLNGEKVYFDAPYQGKEGFYQADVSAFVKLGQNELVACYSFYQDESVYHALFGEGVTESLRNCMHFNVTLDTLYLCGHFGVYANKITKCNMDGIFHAQDFYIGKAPIKVRNSITDGLPFFSGCLTISKHFVSDNKNVQLCCKGRYHYIEVRVNGKDAGVLLFDDTLDISAFTRMGENVVECSIYTGNRNTLGPHHMKSLEEEFAVSPYSFDLFGTWQDGESTEFANHYTFIRFGFYGPKKDVKMEKYVTIFEDGNWFIEDKAPIEAVQGTVLARWLMQTQSEKAYSELELYTEDGNLVDSCFVAGKTENVAAETGYRVRNEKRFITLKSIDMDDMPFGIFNVQFEKAKPRLFNGEMLYQLAPAYAQSMGYVFVTKQGKVLVFDGGHFKDAENLTKIIQKHGGVVHHWVITHYHNDHIGALMEIFEKNAVKVENLYYDFPAVELLADRGDEDNPLVEQLPTLIPSETKVFVAKKGLQINVDGVIVTALNDACFEKRGNFANDSSICFKLETSTCKVLFTGDLGAKGDEYLLDEAFVSQIQDCNVVQMSHHGQNGVSKKFYQAIAIEVCLYPTPGWLWDNNNGGGKNSSGWTTLKTREWMREQKVRKSYTSIRGLVVIR